MRITVTRNGGPVAGFAELGPGEDVTIRFPGGCVSLFVQKDGSGVWAHAAAEPHFHDPPGAVARYRIDTFPALADPHHLAEIDGKGELLHVGLLVAPREGLF